MFGKVEIIHPGPSCEGEPRLVMIRPSGDGEEEEEEEGEERSDTPRPTGTRHKTKPRQTHSKSRKSKIKLEPGINITIFSEDDANIFVDDPCTIGTYNKIIHVIIIIPVYHCSNEHCVMETSLKRIWHACVVTSHNVLYTGTTRLGSNFACVYYITDMVLLLC